MLDQASSIPGIQHPRFAVVKLGTSPDISKLFMNLHELGYYEVSFVHDLADSPYFKQPTASPSRSPSSCSEGGGSEASRKRPRKQMTCEIRRNPLSFALEATSSSDSTSFDGEADDQRGLDTKPPLATVEIVETELELSDIGVLNSEESGEILDTFDECQISSNTSNEDEDSDANSVTNYFTKDGTPTHGFARERDYKYKLESGIQNCEECGRQFVQSQFKNILAHAKSHYQIRPYCCPECDEQSTDIDEIKKHIKKSHHKDAEPLATGVACEKLRSEWATVARKCFPNLVDRIDKWENNVKKIYAAQKKAGKLDALDSFARFCSDERSSETVILGGKWVGNLHIPCKLCGKVLACRDVSILVRHTKTHHPIKQFACPYCDYTNAERRNMRQHMESAHPGKPYLFQDRRDQEMEESWVSIGRSAFPEMADRLEEAIQSYKPKNKLFSDLRLCH